MAVSPATSQKWSEICGFSNFLNFLKNYLRDLNKNFHSQNSSKGGPVCVFEGKINFLSQLKLFKNSINRVS